LTVNQDKLSAETRVVHCDVAAQGRVRVPVEVMPDMRRRPGPVAPDTLPPTFLKHSDEQTVVGLAAVYHAIHDNGLTGTEFTHWGVLAAPRFLGWPMVGATLPRFAAEGAWGVSPHLIPHRSLHSTSGTVSNALKIQGPNFGVGGGPNAILEVLLAATSMLECQRLPGVWVVMSVLDPETPPDGSGVPVPGTFASALALALVPARTGWPGLRLSFTGAPSGTARIDSPCDRQTDVLTLPTLLDLLDRAAAGRTPVVHDLHACGRLEICAGHSLNGHAPHLNGSQPHAAFSSGQLRAETER
jgi:hypothetical protein